MTTITKESITDTIKGLEQLVNRGIQSIYIDMAIAGMRSLLASLEADPVLYAAEETLAYAKHGELHLTCLSEPMGDAVIPLYTAPPAPVSVPEPIKRNDADGWWMYKGRRVGGGCAEWYNLALDDCRAAMLQSFGNSEQFNEIGSWNNHKNTPTAKPATDTCELIKQVEGMEVSVDVSTCDADAGHRYFGTVTEVSELDTAKNGYILLVQDAEPNFKPAGNSPVIPDCWIPLSERMPEKFIPVMVMYEDGEMWSAIWSGQFWDDGSSIPAPHSITHWREMPAAPQQEGK